MRTIRTHPWQTWAACTRSGALPDPTPTPTAMQNTSREADHIANTGTAQKERARHIYSMNSCLCQDQNEAPNLRGNLW